MIFEKGFPGNDERGQISGNTAAGSDCNRNPPLSFNPCFLSALELRFALLVGGLTDLYNFIAAAAALLSCADFPISFLTMTDTENPYL